MTTHLERFDKAIESASKMDDRTRAICEEIMHDLMREVAEKAATRALDAVLTQELTHKELPAYAAAVTHEFNEGGDPVIGGVYINEFQFPPLPPIPQLIAGYFDAAGRALAHRQEKANPPSVLFIAAPVMSSDRPLETEDEVRDHAVPSYLIRMFNAKGETLDIMYRAVVNDEGKVTSLEPAFNAVNTDEHPYEINTEVSDERTDQNGPFLMFFAGYIDGLADRGMARRPE